MRLKLFLPAIFVVFGMISCVKEEINMENLSKDVAIEREIAMPLFKGALEFADIAGESYDSSFIFDGDTVKLYLIQDIEYEDTLSLGELGDEYDLEYLNIHHSFTSMFPVGLDIRFYLHDSLTSSNIDTVYFSGDPNELFLLPAPVDNDGFVIEENVETNKEVLEFDTRTLDNLMNRSTHMVLVIRVPSSDQMVKILNHYSLDLKLGIEAKGYYQTTLDSEE